MSDEAIAPAETPKGLDNILSAALENYVEPGTPEPEKEAAPAEAAAETEETKAQRERDEKGRFTAKAKELAEDEGTPKGTTEAKAASAEVPTPDPAVRPIEPPAHFTAEQKAEFAKLAPEAKNYVSQIEKAREAEYTRRSQEHAEFKRNAEPLLQAVQPFDQYLRQIAPQVGQSPAQMISSILATEYRLRNAPPVERYQAFAQLAQSYGIDLANFASGQIPAQHQPTQQPYTDPRILNDLEATKRALAEIQREREATAYTQQINAFASEKDEQGQPKYPYFEKVRHVMASIIQSGQADNLSDAYKLSVEPMRELIDKEIAAKKSAVEAEQKAALEKAKKAAPVKTSSGAIPKGSTQAKGIDAHISAAMEKVGYS